MNMLEKLSNQKDHPVLFIYLVYLFQFLSFIFLIPLVFGVIISYCIRPDMREDSYLLSHVDWQIKSFWISLGMILVGVLTYKMILFEEVGIAIIGLAYGLIFYRSLKGFIKMIYNQPITENHFITIEDIKNPTISRNIIAFLYLLMLLTIFLALNNADLLFFIVMVIIYFWLKRFDTKETNLSGHYRVIKRTVSISLLFYLIILVLRGIKMTTTIVSFYYSMESGIIHTILSFIVENTLESFVKYFLFVYIIFVTTCNILKLQDTKS